MANNCVSNFRIVSGNKDVLDGIAATFNSLRERFPDDPNYWWGQTSLKHLSEVLGVPANECRGYLDSEPWLEACLTMCGRNASPRPFTVVPAGEGFALSFSVVSGWDTPSWLVDWLQQLVRDNEKHGLAFGYRATDEFNNFHSAYRGDIIGSVYEIDHEDGGCYDYGEEKAFLENISLISGIPFSDEQVHKAEEGQFSEILEAVDNYNEEHEDQHVYVHVYEESKYQ